MSDQTTENSTKRHRPIEGFLLVHYDGSSSPNATLYPTREARLKATQDAVFFEYDEEEHGDEFRTIVEQLTEEGTWGTEGDGALAWMSVDAEPFLDERYVAVPEFP